jgi:hypothetical protein
MVGHMRQTWANYQVSREQHGAVIAALTSDGFKARTGHQPFLLAVLVGEGTDDAEVAEKVIERVTGQPAKLGVSTVGTHHFKPYRGRTDG